MKTGSKFLSLNVKPKFILEQAQAAEDGKKPGPMVLQVTVIKAGMSLDQQYFFPADALEKSGPKAMADVKMYTNHPDFIEQMSGGRDVHNLVGFLRRPKYDPTEQALVADAEIFDSAWRAKLNDMAEAGVLDQMDLSVHVDWEYERRKQDGVLVMQKMKPHPTNSLDFVYVGNAGGAVNQRLAASMFNKEKEIMDEKEVQAAIDKAMEPLKAQLKAAEDRATEAEKKTVEAENKLALAAAEKTLGEKLAASKLPEPTQKLIQARFQNKADLAGLDDEIAHASALIQSIGLKETKTETPESGVKGLGDATLSQAASTPEAKAKTAETLKASLVARFMGDGMSRSDAEKRADARISQIK